MKLSPKRTLPKGLETQAPPGQPARGYFVWLLHGVEGAGMSNASVLLEPVVLGRDKLDERRWAYALRSPFDLTADPTDLIGLKAHLSGMECEIRGYVPRMPPRRITAGEPIELLVVAAGG